MKVTFYNADGSTFATYTVGTGGVVSIVKDAYGSSVVIKNSSADLNITIGNMPYKITQE